MGFMLPVGEFISPLDEANTGVGHIECMNLTTREFLITPMQVSKKVRLLEEQDIIQNTFLHLKHAYLLWENIVHLLVGQ